MQAPIPDGPQHGPITQFHPIEERVVDAARQAQDDAANDDRAVTAAAADAANPLWAITVALAVFLVLGAALATQG